jgi:formylglycine-generating enzyme required for sulfatase activity
MRRALWVHAGSLSLVLGLNGCGGPPGGAPKPEPEGGADAADGAEGADAADGAEGADATDGAEGSDATDGTEGADATDGAEGGDATDGAEGSDATDGAEGGDATDGAEGAEGADATDGAEGGDTDTGGGTGADGADGGVGNLPPGAAIVQLLPEHPNTADPLSVVLLAEAVDPEGDPLTYRYVWYEDSVLRADLTSTVVPASETAKGERWSVQVIANDGLADGGVAVAEVTVLNTPPTATVSLDGAPATTDALVATAVGADLDGDPVGFGYFWTVDGAPTLWATDTVPASATTRGEVWQVSLTPNDGEGDGAAVAASATIRNTPPVGSSVLIGPLPLTEASTAICTPTGWSDPDGDLEAWQLSWLVNGAAAGSGPTLTGTSFSRGDTLACVAVPDDGTDLGAPLRSVDVPVDNSPPSLAGLTLSTLSPTESDTLSVILGATSDADGDAVSLLYAWSVNGAPVASGPTLAPTMFAKGDRVEVTVTPDDGAALGSPARSPTATVLNSAPTVSALSLSPSHLTTDDTLTVSAVGADLDGDPVSFSYAWSVNGAGVAATGSSLSGGLYFNRGDTVEVAVRPSDGAAWGPVRSGSVVVQSAAPTAPVVALRPADPVEGEALVCEVLSESTDPDGDLLTYSFSWTVDGTAFVDVTDTALVGDTVPAGATLAGEAWTCAASASDGAIDGPTAEDTVEVAVACGDGAVSLSVAGIDFVTICAGSFTMGCTPGVAPCYLAESPGMPVTLTRSYYLSQTEVTQGEYLALMGTNPSVYLSSGLSAPVDRVNWHQAAEFANAVSAAAGLPQCYSCTGSSWTVTCSVAVNPYDCEGYRLATEAEWEGAARCGTDLTYAGSAVRDTVAWSISNSGFVTHPVASKAPNACGLMDMSGNVSEWVHDQYDGVYYTSSGRTDPTGGTSSWRVRRGGDLTSGAYALRVSHRFGDDPTIGYYSGVRLARTAD